MTIYRLSRWQTDSILLLARPIEPQFSYCQYFWPYFLWRRLFCCIINIVVAIVMTVLIFSLPNPLPTSSIDDLVTIQLWLTLYFIIYSWPSATYCLIVIQWHFHSRWLLRIWFDRLLWATMEQPLRHFHYHLAIHWFRSRLLAFRLDAILTVPAVNRTTTLPTGTLLMTTFWPFTFIPFAVLNMMSLVVVIGLYYSIWYYNADLPFIFCSITCCGVTITAVVAHCRPDPCR